MYTEKHNPFQGLMARTEKETPMEACAADTDAGAAEPAPERPNGPIAASPPDPDTLIDMTFSDGDVLRYLYGT